MLSFSLLASRPSGLFLAILVAVEALAPPICRAADSALDQAPGDAWGVVRVRDLAATSDKLDRLIKIFAKLAPGPLPAPLAMVQAATGLGPGVDEHGEALFAAMPGGSPLLAIPIADYGQFAAAVNGDPAGEICPVTVAGQDVLLARRGSFALLMNTDQRERLERLVAENPAPPAALAPLAAWLTHQDVAVALLPAGVAELSAAGQRQLTEIEADMEKLAEDPAMADTFEQARQGFALYHELLGFCEASVETAVAGLAIDDATNLRVSVRLGVSESSSGALPQRPADAPAPFAALAAGPYVVAGGGPTSADLGQWSAKFASRMMRRLSGTKGFEELTEEDWKNFEDAQRAKTEGVRSVALVMRPGEADDPVVSNVYAALAVDDSTKYLQSMRKACELANQFLEKSTHELKGMQSEVADATVGERPAITVTADVLGAAADPNVPFMDMWMKSLFGADGKMRTYVVAAAPKLAVSGIDVEEGVAAMMEETLASGPRLADDDSLQTMLKLLDREASWQAAISPSGTVAWAARVVSAMMQIGGAAPPIPEFPASPPVGFSGVIADRQVGGEMVWPVETLRTLADYIETCQQGAP